MRSAALARPAPTDGAFAIEPIAYRMRNEVNGQPIEIKGNGTLSQTGITEISADISEVPVDWNPIVVPLICSGPGPGPNPMASGEVGTNLGGLISIARHGYRTSPGTHRLASLFDSKGQQIASVRATGIYQRDNTGLSFDIAVQTRTKRSSIINNLSRVDHYSFTIHPNGPGKVVVYSHYSLSAEEEKIYGWTRIHYDLIHVQNSLAETLIGSNDISVRRNGTQLRYTSRQRVYAQSELGQAYV